MLSARDRLTRPIPCRPLMPSAPGLIIAKATTANRKPVPVLAHGPAWPAHRGVDRPGYYCEAGYDRGGQCRRRVDLQSPARRALRSGPGSQTSARPTLRRHRCLAW